MFGSRPLRGEWEERLATALDLADKGGFFAKRTLRRTLGDANPDVRIAAIRGLMRHKGASVEHLLPLLQDLYLDRGLPQTVIPFPVRAEAWQALQTLGWKPKSKDDLLLIAAAEGRSIANHRYVTYFLGAGFAHAYGMPLAGELLGHYVREAWRYPQGIRTFATDRLGCATPEALVALTMEPVLDALYTAANDGDELARNVLRDLQWWLKYALDAGEMVLPWKPANPMLDRFFRFLANNNQHNFIITTNWDTHLDAALLTYIAEGGGKEWPPYIDYGLYFQDRLRGSIEYVPVHLYKMNGSTDWFWCEHCRVVYGRYLPFAEHSHMFTYRDPDIWFSGDRMESFRCRACHGPLSILLIMPSPRRPQHLFARVHIPEAVDGSIDFQSTHGMQWTSVLQWMVQAMSPASLWVFIGYSLPEYDVDTLNLMRFAMELAGSLEEIHVVGWEPNFRSQEASPMCRRYAEVLKRPFRYFPAGVDEWIRTQIPDNQHVPAP
jgi:hypothetical protein